MVTLATHSDLCAMDKLTRLGHRRACSGSEANQMTILGQLAGRNAQEWPEQLQLAGLELWELPG